MPLGASGQKPRIVGNANKRAPAKASMSERGSGQPHARSALAASSTASASTQLMATIATSNSFGSLRIWTRMSNVNMVPLAVLSSRADSTCMSLPGRLPSTHATLSGAGPEVPLAWTMRAETCTWCLIMPFG